MRDSTATSVPVLVTMRARTDAKLPSIVSPV